MIKANFQPVLASDGGARELLQKEFPDLTCYELPSYNIRYAKDGKFLKYKILLSVPSIIGAVRKERKIVSEIIENEDIKGLISDNRFGVFSKKITTVYITHQLNVISGRTTFFSSKLHQKIIKKFDECWVPDLKEGNTLSGVLGHAKRLNIPFKYIGVLSRFKARKSDHKYDVMVLLSGPEPQRTLLENKLLEELKKYKGKIVFVRGVLSESSKIESTENINVVNYALTHELENLINQSDLIISRSGYSTIMDLAVLKKKAFFIPTPGQFEQEYLAKRMEKLRIAPFSSQNDFTLEKLKNVNEYEGFSEFESHVDLDLFEIFRR